MDESLSLNCRLIQSAGDQLFFLAILGAQSVTDRWVGFKIPGRPEAAPAIPALESALGSHSCGALSSAQVPLF